VLGASEPRLFCRETARYYHRLFSATYSRRTPTVMLTMKLRTTRTIGLGFCSAVLVVTIADAQMLLPAAKAPDGATLFKQQCATCHTTNLTDRSAGPAAAQDRRQAGRQGRRISLLGRFRQGRLRLGRRQPRRLARQSASDDPGHCHGYRQPKPETRAAIIAYLKELN
jgi:cytochrome c